MQERDDSRPGDVAYRHSEAIFRSIFHSTFSFIGLLQPVGTLIEANHTALGMAGLTAEDVIGKPFWECFWWQISPATQDTLRHHIALAAKGEESVYAEFYEAEVRMRHRDGDWIWLLDRGKVFSWDAAGNPLMMYGIHQDISERKHREERLRQSEEAFYNNFRYAGIGMALVGSEGGAGGQPAPMCLPGC